MKTCNVCSRPLVADQDPRFTLWDKTIEVCGWCSTNLLKHIDHFLQCVDWTRGERYP